MRRCTLFCAIGLLALAGCGPHVSDLSVGDGESGEGEAVPAGFWDNPVSGGVVVNTPAQARLPFSPHDPSSLGSSVRVVATDPGAVAGAFREIAWVYNDPTYGRFVVVERAVSEPGLEAQMQQLAGQQAGCQTSPNRDLGPTAISTHCSYGDRSWVTLSNGNNALVFVGDNTTFVRWLRPLRMADPPAFAPYPEYRQPALLIDVVGPSDAFTKDEAIAVANRV